MKKKNVSKRRILIILIPVLIAVIVFNFRLPIKKVQAQFITYDDKIPFEGIYFTQENVVYSGDTQGIKLNYNNGDRIAKGFQISANLISPDAGILYTGLDGYENKYNLTNINNVSLNEIENLIKNPVKKPGIKIIDNSEWFICASIAQDEWNNFENESYTEIQINNEKYKDSLIVDKFKNSSGTFLVIRIKNDLDILNLQRGITGYIIKNEQNNAIIVPKSSIVTYSGNEGVFVSVAGYAAFRPVNIIAYSGSSVVIQPDSTAKIQLKEYDMIITNPHGVKVGTKVD